MQRVVRKVCYVFFSQTNLIVVSLTIVVQLFTRSIAVSYLTLGAAACWISVKILKKAIKQPRPRYIEVPSGSGLKKQKKLTYGMPSTHSACTTFYAFYICCASYFLPLHPTLHTADSWIPFGLKTTIPPFVTLWTLSVIQSRVWMEHHTYAQVLVGTIWGGAFAAFWFLLWTRGGLSVIGDQIEIWVRQALLS